MQAGNWQPVARDQEVLFKDVKADIKPYTTKDFPPPDTSLAKAVAAFAESHLDSKTFNHSNRVYYFGLAIIKATFPDWEIDTETWYCTCLLHDIGLAEKFHLTTKMSFEVSYATVTRLTHGVVLIGVQFKGGIVARELLLENGAKEEQADSVCEAIILHQDIWIQSGNISLNGQMIILGT
jgi:cyanamide hydratase